MAVAAHSRAMLPVLGGISGCTRTTRRPAPGLAAANREAPCRGLEDEPAAVRGDAVGELVVGGTQEAGPLAAVLDAAVQDLVGADGQGVGIEGLARLVVEVDPGRAGGID